MVEYRRVMELNDSILNILDILSGYSSINLPDLNGVVQINRGSIKLLGRDLEYLYE